MRACVCVLARVCVFSKAGFSTVFIEYVISFEGSTLR